MPIIFPSFDITGIRPSRWYAAPLDYPKITQSFEFEDGGKNFNEVADNAPRHWEYGHTGLSFADAQQFDDFYNLVRLAQSFDFKDKYGATWHNVYIESYTRNHDAHKSWSITVTFHLVNYDGSFTPAPGPPSAPTGLRATVLSDTSIRWDWDVPDSEAPTVPVMTSPTSVTDTVIHWNWNASTDNIAVTGYDLQVATDSGFTTGVRNIPLGNVLTYADTGRAGSTQYYARVRAHDAIPNNSAYSSSTNATTGAHTWTPADLGTDVFCWYDAEMEGLANNAAVATATDRGPHGNNGTPSGGAPNRPTYKTAICNGLAVYRFDPTNVNQFQIPDPSALTEGHAFIVLKTNVDPPSTNWGLWILSTSTDQALYPFTTGDIYENFGSTIRRGPISAANTADAFHLYEAYSKTNDWANFLDGTSLATDATNTVGFPATAFIGVSQLDAADSLAGDIAAFILVNRKLTGTDLTNMRNYLQTRFATP